MWIWTCSLCGNYGMLAECTNGLVCSCGSTALVWQYVSRADIIGGR